MSVLARGTDGTPLLSSTCDRTLHGNETAYAFVGYIASSTLEDRRRDIDVVKMAAKSVSDSLLPASRPMIMIKCIRNPCPHFNLLHLANFDPNPTRSQATTKRIQKEIASLQKEDLGGIVLEPDEVDIFRWKGWLPGPSGTPYAGGMFEVDIELPKDYP